MTPSRVEMTPQPLRPPPGAPAEMARALAMAHEADVAEALSRVDPAAAAEVLSAFPFEFAVRVLEHPEFERRHEVFRHFATDKGVAFIRAMAPDQQAHLFRELPEADRTRFLEELDAGTRGTLALLLAYPPATAGGIMTTDYLSVPSTWTVGEALISPRSAVGSRCTRSMSSIPTIIASSTWSRCASSWSRIGPRGSWTPASTADSSRWLR
jgi:magnesium transporter